MQHNNQQTAILTKLNTEGIHAIQSALLRDYTTFRLGGSCPLLIEAKTPDDVTAAVDVLNQFDVDYMLIGGGSNLVVSDSGLGLAVIRYVSPTPSIEMDHDILAVTGGTALDALAEYCARAGLTELVVCSGIPGTVGGAVAGNAGAWGWQLGDAVESATICDQAGKLSNVGPDALEFRYRDSRLKHTGEILLSVRLRVSHGDPQVTAAKRQEILAIRASKHPDITRDFCAGSFFRNIEPTSKADRRQAAGHFLEQAGAKQMRVGGAALFPKHANMIIKADDTCTAQDVYDLHKQMKAAVSGMFDLELTPEVRFIGKFND